MPRTVTQVPLLVGVGVGDAEGLGDEPGGVEVVELGCGVGDELGDVVLPGAGDAEGEVVGLALPDGLGLGWWLVVRVVPGAGVLLVVPGPGTPAGCAARFDWPAE